MATNLSGGPWKPSLKEGTRIEVAPFRNGRPFSDYYSYDGFRGTALGPTESGTKLWVEIDGEDPHRSGRKAFPPEVLMPIREAS